MSLWQLLSGLSVNELYLDIREKWQVQIWN
jgi:hypothetical protein